MKLKNILIVVKDIEKSKQFYHDLFGLDIVLDNHGNMILTEGLVLQDEKIWKTYLGKDIVPESNSCELYFEEQNLEAFVEKLEKLYPSIKYVNRIMTHSWGQKVIRFYDLDGNLIDSGNDKDAGRKVRKILDEKGWSLSGIITTHSNADHIGGNQYLQQKTDCKVFSGGIEKAFIEYPILEPSFLYGGYPCKDLRHKFLLAKPGNVIWLKDNGKLEVVFKDNILFWKSV